MTKFKVGDKVRVAVSDEFVPKGTILTVTKGPVGYARGGNYYFEGYPQTDNYCVLGGDLALAFEKPTKNQRITTLEQNVASLESEVAELKAKVEALEKAQSKPSLSVGDYVKLVKSDRGNVGAFAKITEVGAIKGGTPRGVEDFTYKARMVNGKDAGATFVGRDEYYVKVSQEEVKATLKPSPNEQRKAVITEAKAFVAKHTSPNTIDDGWNDKGAISYRNCGVIPNFHVNKEKRTVALILNGASSGTVRGKFFAKCAPDDVFNADIGKAIALGRALGLDVSRFEQAVKPTEVVVGQVVNISNSIGSKDGAKVYAFANGAAGSPGILVTQFYGNRSDGFTWVRTDDAKQITDDTEAKY